MFHDFRPGISPALHISCNGLGQEELLRDATHHDVPVRRRAVKDLGKYREDPEAIEAIAKALGDEDVAVPWPTPT